MKRLAVFSFTCLWLVGCGGAATTQPTASVTPLPARSTTLSAAGDAAFLTLAVRPLRIPEFVGLGAGAVEPALASNLDGLLTDAVIFDSWLGDMTRGFRAEGAPGVVDWPALDPARPLFLRVAEAPDSLEDAVAVFGGAASSMRHVMAVPTTNAAVLRATLEMFVAGCDALPSDVRRCGDDKYIRFVSDDAWVFVILTPSEPQGVLQAEELMAPIDALAQWTFRTGAAAAFVRPARIRGAAAHEGARIAGQAIANASPEYVELMRAAALSEITGAFLRSGPYGREIDALGLVLRPDPLSISARATLSETGAALFSMGTTTAARSDGAEDSPLQIRTSFDVDALVTSASRPFGYAGATTAGEIAQAMQRCGIACLIRTAFEPFGYASLLLEGGSPSVALDGLARFETNPSLPAGTIDYDARGVAAPLLLPARAMAFRSTLRGRHWSGGLSLDAEHSEAAMAFAVSAPEGPVAPNADGNANSLRCLEELGQGVASALAAATRAAPEDIRRLVETARADIAGHAACVSDPGHFPDRDGYLAAFTMAWPGPATHSP